jgi:hypothetical protein
VSLLVLFAVIYLPSSIALLCVIAFLAIFTGVLWQTLEFQIGFAKWKALTRNQKVGPPSQSWTCSISFVALFPWTYPLGCQLWLMTAAPELIIFLHLSFSLRTVVAASNLLRFREINPFFFSSSRVWTQGLTLARWVLYYLSYSTSPFMCCVSHQLLAKNSLLLPF